MNPDEIARPLSRAFCWGKDSQNEKLVGRFYRLKIKKQKSVDDKKLVDRMRASIQGYIPVSASRKRLCGKKHFLLKSFAESR